jgi:hypothetical protein
MWRACNLTAFIHSLTRPVRQPFAPRHEGPRLNPEGGGYLRETRILLLALSRYTIDYFFVLYFIADCHFHVLI